MSTLLLCGQGVSWSGETIPAFILIDNFLLSEDQDKKVDTSLVNVTFCEALSEPASQQRCWNYGKQDFGLNLVFCYLILLILIVKNVEGRGMRD